MKVSELIEELKKLNQDATVVVNGYESGYDDIKSITKERIMLNANPNAWCEGRHQPCNSDKSVFAVALNR